MTADAIRGLTTAEATERAARLGPREPVTGSRSARRIVRENVLTLVNAIALGFLVLIALAEAWHDALFAGVIAVNTVIGIWQELSAKRKLDRLALLVAPRARVRRDGAERTIPADEVVPDDIVDLQPGDQVVADGIVVAASGLALDESILTGESDAAAKEVGDAILSGAYCASGSGLYRVTGVGSDSFAHRLTAKAREQKRRPSTLQLEIDRLLRVLLVAMAPLAAVLVAALWLHDVQFREGAQTATAGLISLVPEGLVLLASITFAAGAVRIGRAGALAQQLNAVESLASVDTVCLDKTGTLTDGSLELVEIVAAPGIAQPEAERALARVASAGSVRSATSDAIANALGGAPEETLAEVQFASRWKWSGARFRDTVLLLGAPEALGAGPLATEVARRQGERARVLVFGTADELPEAPGPGQVPATPPGFRPVGLAVIRERMRPEAREVVAYLRDEGVDLKVMSGDAPGTVEAVARAAGFADTSSITGADLPDDPAALEEIAAAHAIFARVTPEQKQALIEALARRGRYTAMVGDGVNDVPAMKAARIAIALGSGAQIARGVSDIVLIGNDFRAIPLGIAEGRRILANIRRVAKLFVVKSSFAATLILTVGVAGVAYPLLPRHLSLAAFFTIGVPAFALALAPSSGRPPRLAFMRDLLRFAVPGGVVSGGAVILAYSFARSVSDVPTGRTVALVVLVLTGLYLVLLLEDEAMQHSRVRAHSVLLLMGVLLAGFVAVFLIEPVRSFFALEVLGFVEWLLALVAFAFAVGVFGLLRFRIPFVSRRLFG